VRVLGLDVGDKTIGISISDELGWTAQGLDVLRRNGDVEEDLERLLHVINQYQVERIVVGFPKNMNGTVGPRGELCKEFALLVEQKTGIPVVLWDERLSTVAAERALIEADLSRKKRKRVVDKLAAVMILQGYLDSVNR
jgi:putative Holliday junction resolvase